MQRFILSFAAWAARVLPMPLKRALYRFEPLARLIRGGLNRAAPQGLSTVTIAAGGLQGQRMALDLQSEKDYWLGVYEPQLQSALKDLARPGDVIYDLGANIGYITLLAAKLVGAQGRVHAFEALPDNQTRLRQNIALNMLEQRVTVYCGAVTDRPGEVSFLVGPSGGTGKAAGSAGRQGLEYVQELHVPGVSLDAYVFEQNQPPPDLVKIDIEGGEMLALPGMQRVLAEAKPVVLIELHGQEAGRVVWQTLVDAGYSFHEMRTGFPPAPPLERLDWKSYLVSLPPGSRSPRERPA